MCNLFAWFGTLGVLSFMKKWGDFDNKFSRWACKEAWGVYLFHYLPLAVSAWYLRQLAPNMFPVFVYLLVAFAAFFGAICLYNIVSRIPFIRWCVLGMKK